MSNTIVIPASTSRSRFKEPHVNVTTPRGGAQLRIAFNVALVEKADLGKVTHIAIEHDPEKKHLKFRPCDGVFENLPAHRLQTEGKGGVRMVLLQRGALEFLPVRPYKIYSLNKGFAIHYGDE